jgi:hypothetical protein
MTERALRDERRRCRRLRAADGAFAFMKDETGLVGRIIDISREGLSVSYLPKGLMAGSLKEIDIVHYGDRFLIEDVPVRRISDIADTGPFPSSQLPLRRMGARFGELTSEQSSRLEYFIRHHTQGGD